MRTHTKVADRPYLGRLMDLATRYASSTLGSEATIRHISGEDFNVLEAISMKCFRYWEGDDSEDLQGVFESDSSLGFILLKGAEGIGFSLGMEETKDLKDYYSGKAFYGAYSAVVPEHRRNGFYKILSSIRDVASSIEGYDCVIIHSMDKPETLSSHEAVGYVRLELLEDYYCKGYHAWLMKKELNRELILEKIDFLNSLGVSTNA